MTPHIQTDVFQRYAQRQYRTDIQGIRALSAIMIMIYHIWVGKVSGGVDVFFVISGFLMGGVLLRQASRGAINLYSFWGNIIYRIAPSAYLVLLGTLAASYWLLPSTLWDGFLSEMLYSAIHLENYKLIDISADYLSRDEPQSPVQHYWALSIQIQFLVTFPIVFYGAVWLSKKKHSIKPVQIIIATLATLSFCYSLYLTSINPSAAYFSFFSRYWEFLIGAYLSTMLYQSTSASSNNYSKEYLSYAALIMLFGSGIIIPSHMNFPGYVALIPVAAAVLLILCGSSGKTFTYKILSNKKLVNIGQYSFTIYLCHWPILIYFQHRLWEPQLGLLPGLMVIALSIILSFLIHSVIARVLSTTHRPKSHYLYAIGATCFVTTILSIQAFKYHAEKTTKNLPPPASHQITIDPELFSSGQSINKGSLAAIKSKKPRSYKDRCHQRLKSPEVRICDYGDSTSNKSIALVGGSHAAQWLPVLDSLGQAHQLKIINITKSDCPFGATEGLHPSCRQWNQQVIEKLKGLNPEVVITNSTRTSTHASELVPKSYITQWKKVMDLGIQVIGIRDNPRFTFDMPTCLSINIAQLSRCAIRRETLLAKQDPSLGISKTYEKFSSIDMNGIVCDEEFCHGSYKDEIIYRDADHLNSDYVILFSETLKNEITSIRPQLFETE